jgi:hypothetical protein
LSEAEEFYQGKRKNINKKISKEVLNGNYIDAIIFALGV